MTDKAAVGIVEIVREHYPDPTAKAGEPWVVVDVKAVEPLPKPVTLAAIKAEPKLKAMVLVNNTRLSVQPVTGGRMEDRVQDGRAEIGRTHHDLRRHQLLGGAGGRAPSALTFGGVWYRLLAEPGRRRTASPPSRSAPHHGKGAAPWPLDHPASSPT